MDTQLKLTVRTAEHGGRLRKYYHITSEGQKRLEEFKNEWREVMKIYQFVTKEDAIHE
jgi:PadR family transcriptional regulator PadR